MASAVSHLLVILVLGFFFQVHGADKQKRQIFREQVLPSKGGKIPEEAFRADRLALNRLNKEGITIPDGVILEARHVHKHFNPSGAMPEVLKVYLTPDGRYVPPEGRNHYEHPKTVDTTYLVRRPAESQTAAKFGSGYRGSSNALSSYSGRPGCTRPNGPRAFKPIHAPLVIPLRDEFEHNTYFPNRQIWGPEYSWEVIYDPFDEYFVNDIPFFDSHQIITNYEGFLNDYHDRSFRRSSGIRTVKRAASTSGSKPVSHYPETESSRYTGLVKIPKTKFKCGEKRGMFPDPDTKCQVFHLCRENGISSFLCAAGTAFSETKQRCEWWDTVTCGSGTTDTRRS
ncbi:uncharacterized protein LOC124295297 [Neodiprion lecontei]|uniref:Uncharacterized protein LOC124295297 n=1 Tax=Neodiprion lecontei TaxID=441921 RepID=A0ABM3GKH5_NEOLC|nr:uncharacterized protein LOC124295297 [Neodiprion lecontei]